MSGALHLGIDVGTQGARALLVTDDGQVVARGTRALAPLPAGPVQEQAPSDWWDAVVGAVLDLGDRRREVGALAISCTSGSVCAVDAAGAAVGPGLLYADARGAPGADPSWAVAKVGWLVAERPDLVARAARFTSPGGYLAARLLGRPAAIDVTQALKFGYDPAAERWGSVPVDEDRLPPVVRTGAVLGTIDPTVADGLGLPTDALVVAGATDGVAGQFACAPTPGRWAITIGSTIVWKAVAPRRIDAPDRGIYSHRGPDGWWFPGAASSAGARILSTWATPADLEAFDGAVAITPDTPTAYPSVAVGERFPFVDPTFVPWAAPDPAGPRRYSAEVLGAALVERWGCEALVAAGCEPPTTIATAGGATASGSWVRLRAAVLGVPIEVPTEPSAAYGAAVIAASTTHGGPLEASAAMVRVAARVEPGPDDRDRWTAAATRFRDRCMAGAS